MMNYSDAYFCKLFKQCFDQNFTAYLTAFRIHEARRLLREKNAKVSYSQMQTQMKALGYDNVWIGTVEGEPEETECGQVIEAVSQAGYQKVILRPLMVVAGEIFAFVGPIKV